MADLLIRALPVRLEAAYCYRLKENRMPVKLIVMYPRPKDVQAFETVYKNEHVRFAGEKLPGKTQSVATRVLGSPSGKPAFHRIAEVHFPSMQALEACAASEEGKETLANAVSI